MEAEEVNSLSPSPKSRSDSATRKRSFLDTKRFLKDDVGRVTDFYRKVGDLGEGAFGDVWMARQRVQAKTPQEHLGRSVAIKRVRKTNDEQAPDFEAVEDFRAEVELMKALDHPCICRLLQVFEDSKNLYLVMEHIKGGELFERVAAVGSFSEHDAARVIQQVASALAYCHSHGVVHRDIKPENIMVIDEDTGTDSKGTKWSQDEELTVKLIDFGFGCRILSGVSLRPKVGSFLYNAPEVLAGKECNEKQDIWSLGCVMYVLLSAEMPFSGPDARKRILEGSHDFDGEAWSKITSSAKKLIEGLLVVDASKRLSADDVHRHEWLAETEEELHGHVAAKRASLAHMDSLRALHQHSNFRHVCAGVLAKQMDESLLHKLHSAFCTIDKDENGILSMTEFREACESFDEDPIVFSKIREMFAEVDMDGSGSIDYTEFVAACMDRKIEEQESVCWSAFQVFDQDGNGTISYEELEQVMQNASMRDTFSKETLDELWNQLLGVDADNDTATPQSPDLSIDFEHFLATLRGVRVPAVGSKAPPPEPVPGESSLRSTSSGGYPASDSAPGLQLRPPLPVSRRAEGAARAMGLPVARRGSPPAGGGLPIASKAGGLPIASKGGGGLPIAGGGGGGLPIASKGGGLPIDGTGGGGLPVAGRGGGPTLPGMPSRGRQ